MAGGAVKLPRDLKKAVYRDHRRYRIHSEPDCDAALFAQRRVDESHWDAIHLEERALEPDPMPTWELGLWVSGGGIAGFLVGVIIGVAIADRIVVQR